MRFKGIAKNLLFIRPILAVLLNEIVYTEIMKTKLLLKDRNERPEVTIFTGITCLS